MFVVASKQHICAVGRWSKRTMILHWRLGLSVSFLAVLAGTLTAWAVETHSEQVDQELDWAVETPREQLGQEIKLPPTPAYQDYYEDSSLSPVSSDGTECDVSEIGHYDEYACHDVITKVTDPAELASITQELNAGQMGYADVMEVSFGSSELGDTRFTSYCFDFEFRAADLCIPRYEPLDILHKTICCIGLGLCTMLEGNFRESRKGEVRRIPIPRTPVNKGMRKGRGG
jgi:hypothetical protein